MTCILARSFSKEHGFGKFCRGGLFVAIGFLLSGGASFSQTIIEGDVLDRITRQSLPGVNVFVKGTDIGTVTNGKGHYLLRIPGLRQGMSVVFRHIGYEEFDIDVFQLLEGPDVTLQPRVIPLGTQEIEGERIEVDIEKDLPQVISVLEPKLYRHVDAGELLRMDHSIQVEETLTGEKTLSIRGGNPDEVIVLYNGIKMNNVYDNIFDPSLIDLEDVERLEVIKGSNTVLYGSEALSGVINIVPVQRPDYRIRFQQQIGSYQSGKWGLHLHHKTGPFRGMISTNQGQSRRRPVGAISEEQDLLNNTAHYTASLIYLFPGNTDNSSKRSLTGSFLSSELKYEDQRSKETVLRGNELISVRYSSEKPRKHQLNVTFARHKNEEDRAVDPSINAWNQRLQSSAFYLNADAWFVLSRMEWLLAYQFEDSGLDTRDSRMNSGYFSDRQETAEFKRRLQGFASVMKFQSRSGSELVRTTDLNISFRYDRIWDQQLNLADRTVAIAESVPDLELTGDNEWQETTIKLATVFSGGHETTDFFASFTYGTNVKFPTLFQQISVPVSESPTFNRPNLNPEKNRSLEANLQCMGIIPGTPIIENWSITFVAFQNYYENKFRMTFPLGIPVAYYDNVADAKISGFESTAKLFLFQKSFTLEMGLSRYRISEKAAFPFRSDRKKTLTGLIDHQGNSFIVHWFNEGKQTGWVRQETGEFLEMVVPSYTNMDLHWNWTFEWKRWKMFSNASARNVLGSDAGPQGIALRDRRFYLTMGIQL